MNIVWLRHDLRLLDNPALSRAAEEAVIVVYIYEEGEGRPYGAASRWWLHHALIALDRDLAGRGGKLIIARGDPAAELCRLTREHGVCAVYINERYDAAGKETDTRVEESLAEIGISLIRNTGSLLHEPSEIRTAAGTPYGVFTPFRNALFKLPKRDELPIPTLTFSTCTSLDIDELELLPQISWDGGLYEAWPNPTEAGAHEQLDIFLRERVGAYKRDRDFPDLHATSRLSPYLRFGQISPITVWHRTNAVAGSGGVREGCDHFLSELTWREFSYNLLAAHPDLAHTPLKPEFARYPWRNDPDHFDAWKRGVTGVPIVDAGMRELWATGYMHNRVRMIVASYLIKNLGISWQEGEQWFWDTLVDADPANNAASWQWVAGCGADAAPFFRIFNPVLQATKFDPTGGYIARWVPELAHLPVPYRFAPCDTPPMELARHGVILGETYPHPLVDLKASRNEALAHYDAIRRS